MRKCIQITLLGAAGTAFQEAEAGAPIDRTTRGAVMSAGVAGLPAVPVQQCPVELEAFELVLLRRPPDAPSYPEDVLQRIQEEHLAYHAQLREAGDIVTNGPVSDQPDASLRGLTFYRTGSLAHARQFAEADPAVRAGRLTVEIMTWYCPPGTMSQPGRTVSLS
jgi:uncharacterized protein